MIEKHARPRVCIQWKCPFRRAKSLSPMNCPKIWTLKRRSSIASSPTRRSCPMSMWIGGGFLFRIVWTNFVLCSTRSEFYERYALCTRPSWTCSVTGKTGLTYAQALQSERDSTQTLSSIPRVLQRALLHLVTYMDADFSLNMTLGALCEYTSHRYFIGETVRIGGKNKK